MLHKTPSTGPRLIAGALLSLFAGVGYAHAGEELGAASTVMAQQMQEASAPAGPACANCATVLSARQVEVEGEASGVGAVTGGVAGGVLGHQIGQGSGRDIATIAGAVGGALAGHNIEKKMKRAPVYEVVLRMDSGEQRVMRFPSPPGVIAGDKVRIEGDHLIRQ